MAWEVIRKKIAIGSSILIIDFRIWNLEFGFVEFRIGSVDFGFGFLNLDFELVSGAQLLMCNFSFLPLILLRSIFYFDLLLLY